LNLAFYERENSGRKEATNVGVGCHCFFTSQIPGFCVR
jgi:hypothetical protein